MCISKGLVWISGGFKRRWRSRNSRFAPLRLSFWLRMGTMGDFRPGNGIVAQTLLSVSDVSPRFIDPGSLHSRTAGGAPCSSRRSASLLRPLGALGFGPTGRARLQSPKPLAWDRSLPPPVADEGRRSVGNRKECRLRHDYASFPGPPDSNPRFAHIDRVLS